jgi:hypothetical protein
MGRIFSTGCAWLGLDPGVIDLIAAIIENFLGGGFAFMLHA